MAKMREIYVCSECQSRTSQWKGQCPTCSAWNTLQAMQVSVNKVKTLLRCQAGVDGDNLLQLGFESVNQSNLRLYRPVFRLFHRQAEHAGQAYRRLAADVMLVVMDKQPLDVFQQTPGPGAGRRLGASEIVPA